MAQRLGVTTLTAGQLGPATVLGTQPIPLIQLTGAYATFTNLGKRNPPQAILEITDSTGTVQWSAGKAPNTQVISPQASYMMTNVLIDNDARAPDFKLHNPLTFDPPYNNMQLAAKTGTSSGNVGPRDIVTEGYSPDHPRGLGRQQRLQ